MTQEHGSVERLSKKLSLMAQVSPESLNKMADMLQYNRDNFILDIQALEKETKWQDNDEEAKQWHEKGRECFNRQAYQESFLCFCKGAENGNAEDMYILGCCYSEGRGTRQSDEEALRWYQKSAYRGYPEAMYSIALCYEQGIGVERNMELAQKWFMEAAKAGYCPSGERSYFESIKEYNTEENIVSKDEDDDQLTEDQAKEAQASSFRPELGPMEKKVSKMLEAMGVHISDDEISKLNDAVKENKPFPEMVRDFSSMVYKDNPSLKGAFDSVSDKTITSWKEMLDNLFKGEPKS